jgi:hypothetical protein
MALPLPQLFGIIPTGLPPIITPTSAPSPTSFVFTLPARPYNHIVVFILPGITLPPNSAAAVYIQLPPSQIQQNGGAGFTFLGAVGEGKESAIFRIKGLVGSGSGGVGNGEVAMDAPEDGGSNGEITLGISIESAESVAAQMAALSSPQATSNSQALVVAPRPAAKPDTLVLAQRIIKNAFNFLASFSGNTSGGVEVVPLKAFEEWWRKFEGRVRSDPGFLERDGD